MWILDFLKTGFLMIITLHSCLQNVFLALSNRTLHLLTHLITKINDLRICVHQLLILLFFLWFDQVIVFAIWCQILLRMHMDIFQVFIWIWTIWCCIYLHWVFRIYQRLSFFINFISYIFIVGHETFDVGNLSITIV